MNRGRHKLNKTNKIVKLASQCGAHYPEGWKCGISYENLIKLINTQKKMCRFNNLNIFETNYTTCNTSKGGFVWDATKEGRVFWSNCLGNLYHGIQNYIKNNQNKTILEFKSRQNINN